MINKIHEILRDPECRWSIGCFMLACVFVFILFMLFSLASRAVSLAYTNSNAAWRLELMENKIGLNESMYREGLEEAQKQQKRHELSIHYGRAVNVE